MTTCLILNWVNDVHDIRAKSHCNWLWHRWQNCSQGCRSCQQLFSGCHMQYATQGSWNAGIQNQNSTHRKQDHHSNHYRHNANSIIILIWDINITIPYTSLKMHTSRKKTVNMLPDKVWTRQATNDKIDWTQRDRQTDRDEKGKIPYLSIGGVGNKSDPETNAAHH